MKIKKLLFLFSFSLLSVHGFSQQWGGGNDVSVPIYRNGNVGIGTNTPSFKLDLKSLNGEAENLFRAGVYDAPEDYFSVSNATLAPNQFIPSLYGYHSSDNRQALYIVGAIGEQNDSGTQPIVVFDSRLKSGAVTNRPLFAWDSYGKRNMTLFANGGLGIGTSTPSRYKLNVWGPVRAHEVVVNTSGADFVFADDYALPSLQQVESFIKENRHLPEIPSAAEMQENGLHLAEMNIKLLQKVEDLRCM